MTMRTLDQALPAARALLLASGVALVVLASLFAPLPTPYSDAIANLALQLPQDKARFAQQLQVWAAQPEMLGRYFTLDLFLPAAYALFLALLCGMLARVHADAGRRMLAPVGSALSWLLLVCAPLDWLENRWLARAIDQAPGAADWYFGTGQSLSAGPKWLLLSLALAWLLFALLGLLKGRRVPGH